MAIAISWVKQTEYWYTANFGSIVLALNASTPGFIQWTLTITKKGTDKVLFSRTFHVKLPMMGDFTYTATTGASLAQAQALEICKKAIPEAMIKLSVEK